MKMFHILESSNMKKISFLIFLFLSCVNYEAICSEKILYVEPPLISINELKRQLLIKVGHEPLTNKNCCLSPTACATSIVQSDCDVIIISPEKNLWTKYLEYNKRYIIGESATAIIEPSVKAAFKDMPIEKPIAELIIALELQNHEVTL